MKNLFNKIKSLDKGTIIRTSLLIMSYINQIIALIGMTSFASCMWYQIGSLICAVLISGICAWKNNDFTNLAQLSGEVLKALKDKKLEEDEIRKILNHANEQLGENQIQK